jgi:hypothetical protein
VLAIRFAHDQGAAALYFLAFAKWLIGDNDAAFRLIGEAKSLAERVGHAPTSVAAYGISAWLDCVRGDHARARANSETAVRLARDFDLPLWRSTAGFCLAWTMAASDGNVPPGMTRRPRELPHRHTVRVSRSPAPRMSRRDTPA